MSEKGTTYGGEIEREKLTDTLAALLRGESRPAPGERFQAALKRELAKCPAYSGKVPRPATLNLSIDSMISGMVKIYLRFFSHIGHGHTIRLSRAFYKRYTSDGRWVIEMVMVAKMLRRISQNGDFYVGYVCSQYEKRYGRLPYSSEVFSVASVKGWLPQFIREGVNALPPVSVYTPQQKARVAAYTRAYAECAPEGHVSFGSVQRVEVEE
jgi:hypothetical protein